MSDAAFDALIDGNIERSAAGNTDMPAEVFVDILLERIAENSGATITSREDRRMSDEG